MTSPTTPRALELTGRLHQALQEIECALDPPAFDPKVDRRAFWLGANDYKVTTILPQLMARLASEAPGTTLWHRATLPPPPTSWSARAATRPALSTRSSPSSV